MVCGHLTYSFVKVLIWILALFCVCPIDEEMFKILKEEGNQCVKDKNYKDALSKYSECLKINKECAIYTNRQVLCNFLYFLCS